MNSISRLLRSFASSFVIKLFIPFPHMLPGDHNFLLTAPPEAVYFLSSHLLHSSGSLVEGRTPNNFAAINRYKNPSSGTLHFLHFLAIAYQCPVCPLRRSAILLVFC